MQYFYTVLYFLSYDKPQGSRDKKTSYKLELNGSLWYNTLGKSELYETLCVMPGWFTWYDVKLKIISK